VSAIFQRERIAAQGVTERGQILVLFAFCLVAIIAMVGLILDGGGAFAQRRHEQTAVDLAALAGANRYFVSNNPTDATTTARAVAAANGYVDGVAGASVDVTVGSSPQVGVKVTITAPHANTFSALLGQPSWTVEAQAGANAGFSASGTFLPRLTQ
jgi:Flp pilus assembly protein TadG